MGFSNAAREAYGSPDLLGWFIMFYGAWLIYKMVKDYNDDGFGGF